MADPSIRIHNEVYPFIRPSKFRGLLKGKVVIITGAAGAIGQGHAESFAVSGASLYLIYNKTTPSSTLEKRCRKFGAESVTFVQCDVSKIDNCERLINQVLDLAGRVDILINNAGANSLVPMHHQNPHDFLDAIAINFSGPYCLIRFLMPVFRQQRSGCVINIASRAGTVVIPWSTSYCSSKAALINLTGCIQKEVDTEGFDDIQLYALHPGAVRSTMVEKSMYLLGKYSEESVLALPTSVPDLKGLLGLYNDSMYLSGMVSVALASGIARDVLRGKYFDVCQDLEDVLAQAEEIKANPDMYSLHTTFAGGLSNGNMVSNSNEPSVEFPGFDFDA